MRRHGLEMTIGTVIAVVAFMQIIPKFLEGQRRYPLVFDNCNTLDSWRVRSGEWQVLNGCLRAVPDENQHTFWELIYVEDFDPEKLPYPFRLQFDIRFPKEIPRDGEFRAGLGFGIRKSSQAGNESGFALPSLSSALRIQEGKLRGTRLHSYSVGWLGDLQEIQISSKNERISPPVHIQPMPGIWYRAEGHFLSIDLRSGAVEFEGGCSTYPQNSWQLISSSPYVECFDPPRRGLALFIQQTGSPVEVEIDNIRVYIPGASSEK